MGSKILQKSKGFYDVYERKPDVDKMITHYCPGCGHGVVHKMVAEACEDMGILDRTVFISPVGCSVFAYYYFDTGNIQAPHGRSPAVATGVRRALPDSIVIGYQGDGDLAAIGMNNIIQAANRGENFTVFFINNAIYGMTGGQMAPTSVTGQKTVTSPRGRDPQNEGYPIRVCELMATLEAPAYLERVAITDSKHVMKTRKAVRKALKAQVEGRGFSLVEILSPCPVGWKMTPLESKDWITEVLENNFPLGVFRDRTSDPLPERQPTPTPDSDEILRILGIGNGEAGEVHPSDGKEFESLLIKASGFGGQGILMMGVLLADLGMRSGYDVSWLPSYGPEMRGGTAHCHVTISSKRIGSPLITRPHALVAMNRPSLDKFEDEVNPGGAIFYDNSLIDREVKVDGVGIYPIPATLEADKIGSTKAANVIMMGAVLAWANIPGAEDVGTVIREVIGRKELQELNEKAYRRGRELFNSIEKEA